MRSVGAVPIAVAAALLMAGCSSSDSDGTATGFVSDDSAGDGAISDDGTGAGGLRYAGAVYQPTNGISDVIVDSHGHYRVDVQVSDGRFQIGTYSLFGILYTYWFAVGDSVLFTADLYGASRTALTPGRYEFAEVPRIRNEELNGQSVFSQSVFGLDFNGDGDVDDNERLDVVGGSIDVSGSDAASLVLEIDVLLVDGQRVQGRYAQGFELVD